MTQKGIYPYDYMNSIERFNETKLFSKEYFYSKLNDSNISDEERKYAESLEYF